MFLLDTEKIDITYQDETMHFIPLAKLFILEHTHLENILLAPVYIQELPRNWSISPHAMGASLKPQIWSSPVLRTPAPHGL